MITNVAVKTKGLRPEVRKAVVAERRRGWLTSQNGGGNSWENSEGAEARKNFGLRVLLPSKQTSLAEVLNT